jgi:hypothetical protein
MQQQQEQEQQINKRMICINIRKEMQSVESKERSKINIEEIRQDGRLVVRETIIKQKGEDANAEWNSINSEKGKD